MDPVGIALLTLAALLTGALLPLIFQARATLRSAQRVLDTSGPKLAATLTDMAAATQEIAVIARDLASTLDQVRGAVGRVSTIGGMVGPAVVAAVQAFRAVRGMDSRHEPSEAPDLDRENGEKSAG